MEELDDQFINSVCALSARPAALPAEAGLPLLGDEALNLFAAQATSRHIDLAARRLRASGHGHYSVGSSGHEGNAAVAAALRADDPALLHYRSGAFYVARAMAAGAARVPGVTDPVHDVLLGVVAGRGEPIAGGRHKLLGNRTLHILPQTSTLASHLPRAMGLALAIERAAKLRLKTPYRSDAVVLVSFGDGSVNHSTAVGAIQAALHCAHQTLRTPLLFLCEDNGLGISVPTPRGWVEDLFGSRPGLHYVKADGSDLFEAYSAALSVVDFVRKRRRPAFLHLRTVRLGGHAGGDVEGGYRRAADIEQERERDPVWQTARRLVEYGIASPEQLIERYTAIGAHVAGVEASVREAGQLSSADEVMAPIARPPQQKVRFGVPDTGCRKRFFGGVLPESEARLTLAQTLNRTLAELLCGSPQVLVFGQDVARKGGIYGVTRRLCDAAGAARVFDTIADESSILGLALGTSLAGFLPVAEIQYLAYLHNAADQLRGEAAAMSFFSQGQYENGMIVRVAAFGYQEGWGGAFQGDNACAALRDIPGLVVAVPAMAEDAGPMLRSCALAARDAGRVCVVLEPIALYGERDLYEPGDGGWLAPYRDPSTWEGDHAPVGTARTHEDGRDLTIVTYGNGLRMSLRVARRLERQKGIRSRVVDLRWLAPLPVDRLLLEAEASGRVLVADECRKSGGISEAILSALVDGGFRGAMRRVTSLDSFVPLGDAARLVQLTESDIEAAALEMVGITRESA